MIGFIKKDLALASIILILGLGFAQKANAASLSSVSDTITTSRPSAATTLTTDQAAGAGQVQVFDQNSTLFLASDSATLWPSVGETLNVVNVASQSASGVPSAGNRIIYFTNTAANAHHNGDAITAAVTATHTIKFTTTSTVPANGWLIITFPGTGQNTASPSATTFSFNNLANSNVTFSGTGVGCATAQITVSAPVVKCQTTTQISGGTIVTVVIGSSTPQLINPTKTASSGNADTWKILIQTLDNNSVVLDSSKAIVGTIEAVQVQATVEPSMTFTITGVNNGVAACSDTTNPGPGLNATATFVNLGSLANGAINISAQTLVVNTNGSAGYVITATSSGRFINPASGFWLADANGGNGLTANDTPAPATFPATGNAVFGIHPCSSGSTSIPTIPAAWGSGATAFSSGAKYSNPWNTGTNSFYATISSYNAPATSSTTTVEYAATVGGTTPSGIYSNYFTYVATPTF